MRPNPHPRVIFAGGPRADHVVRAVIYTKTPGRAQWIEAELVREHILIQTGRGVTDVIAALVEDPAPRPQILVLDFEDLPPAEILELHAIREQGFTGTIFALGRVPIELVRSLRIQQVIAGLIDNALRIAIIELPFDAQTRRLPILSES